MSEVTRYLRRCGWKWQSASWSIVGGAIALLGDCALAQIVPDGTLTNNSIVITSQGNTSLIEGGTQAGSNLFHSFEQFSVPTGGATYFNNAPNIQNIISRVTGKSISNIDGLLQANGTANLFLLNPNGIIFGPNASLNIGGSFVGTTANSLNFADSTQFSATTHPTTPLLTVSVPVGLQFGGTAGSIINQSRATNSSGQRVGLQVLPGKTLSLVGGDVRLDGGRLQAPGGRVELGGVAGAGSVGLFVDSNNLLVSFPVEVPRADVFLTNSADVNVSAGADAGGSIAINAQNLNLEGGSTLRAGIGSGLGFIGSQVGDIEINATGTINLANGSSITTRVAPRAIGKGGSINITTGSLAVTNGAYLSTAVFGLGAAGSINIFARDTVSFDGVSSNGFSSGVFSTVGPGAVGNSGNINITTGSLSFTNGALLFASTRGQGDAGSMNIFARDTVSFDGSAAFSTVESVARGDSGDINITTGSLFMSNGAALVASTRGPGNAGNVNIDARDTVSFNGVGDNQFNIPNFGTAEIGLRNEGSVTINVRDSAFLAAEAPEFSPSGVLSQVELRGVGQGGSVRIAAGSFSVTDGAVLTASTLGQGDAGSVTINATTFEANSGGQVLTTTSSGGKAGNIDINTADSINLSGSKSGMFANTTPYSTGDGGNISIESIQLNIAEGAGVAVDSQGAGNAGILLFQGGSVTLDSRAFLSAAAASGLGGNIRLDLQQLLLMRRNSLISATSGSLGNEGNITIDTGILAALENSDITANAFAGPGANIQITAHSIFGTQFQVSLTPESDIVATGTVELVTPDFDPSRGLVNLPAQPTDTEVAQACTPGGSQAHSEFVITGRGGLPPNPGDSLSTDAVQVDLVTLNPEVDRLSTTAVSTNPTSPRPPFIVEAQGWVIDANGEVILTASASTVTPRSPWQRTAECHAPQNLS